MWYRWGHSVPTRRSVEVPWALRGVTLPPTLSSQPDTRPDRHTPLLVLLQLSFEVILCFAFCFTSETRLCVESPQEKRPYCKLLPSAGGRRGRTLNNVVWMSVVQCVAARHQLWTRSTPGMLWGSVHHSTKLSAHLLSDNSE